MVNSFLFPARPPRWRAVIYRLMPVLVLSTLHIWAWCSQSINWEINTEFHLENQKDRAYWQGIGVGGRVMDLKGIRRGGVFVARTYFIRPLSWCLRDFWTVVVYEGFVTSLCPSVKPVSWRPSRCFPQTVLLVRAVAFIVFCPEGLMNDCFNRLVKYYLWLLVALCACGSGLLTHLILMVHIFDCEA